MPRIVKNPDERRRELLVTAMRLFAEEGYDNVSVRAVARAAGVAPGLAYHYFDSKQNMFDAAIEEYSRRCAEGIIAILDDRGLSLDEKLDQLGDVYYLASYAGRRDVVAELNDYYRSLGVSEENLLDAGDKPHGDTVQIAPAGE